MTLAKDFFGQSLCLGDEVAFMEPHYREMIMGKIVKFTPQTILLEFTNTHGTVKLFRATSQQLIRKPQ